MKNWIFPILLVSLWSCQQSGSTTSVAPAVNVDVSGYEVDPLQTSSAQYLSKRDANGRLIETGFIEGSQRVGNWVTYSYNDNVNVITSNAAQQGGIKTITPYIDGQVNGTFVEFDKQKRLIAQRGYKDGQLHGEVATYHLGRPVEISYYKNGVLDGTYKKYFDNTVNLQMEAN